MMPLSGAGAAREIQSGTSLLNRRRSYGRVLRQLWCAGSRRILYSMWGEKRSVGGSGAINRGSGAGSTCTAYSSDDPPAGRSDFTTDCATDAANGGSYHSATREEFWMGQASS